MHVCVHMYVLCLCVCVCVCVSVCVCICMPVLERKREGEGSVVKQSTHLSSTMSRPPSGSGSGQPLRPLHRRPPQRSGEAAHGLSVWDTHCRGPPEAGSCTPLHQEVVSPLTPLRAMRMSLIISLQSRTYNKVVVVVSKRH